MYWLNSTPVKLTRIVPDLLSARSYERICCQVFWPLNMIIPFVIVAHSGQQRVNDGGCSWTSGYPPSPVTHDNDNRDVVLELFDMYVFYTWNQGHSNEIILSPFTRQVKWGRHGEDQKSILGIHLTVKTNSYENGNPAVVARLMSKGSELKTNMCTLTLVDTHVILRPAPDRQCHAHYRTTEFDNSIKKYGWLRAEEPGQHTFSSSADVGRTQNGVLSQIMTHDSCRKVSVPKRCYNLSYPLSARRRLSEYLYGLTYVGERGFELSCYHR